MSCDRVWKPANFGKGFPESKVLEDLLARHPETEKLTCSIDSFIKAHRTAYLFSSVFLTFSNRKTKHTMIILDPQAGLISIANMKSSIRKHTNSNMSSYPFTNHHSMYSRQTSFRSSPTRSTPERGEQPPQKHMWIVTGPAGCGKSTVAGYLSKELQLPYIEGDDVSGNIKLPLFLPFDSTLACLFTLPLAWDQPPRRK